MLFYREPFNPGRDLVVRKPFPCQGTDYKPGDVFKGVVTDRRLRQMYDNRMLAVAGSSEAKDAVKAHRRANPGLAKSLLDGLGA